MSNSPKLLSSRGRLKFLFRDTIIYGGAGAISKFVSLLAFPVMARYFSVEEYGTIDAFNVLATLLTIVLIFGQDSAIARYFYEYEKKEDRQNVITQSLIIQVCMVVIAMPFLLYYANSISRFYSKQEGLANLVQLIIWQIPFSLMINFAGSILKWNFNRGQFLFIQLGATFFYLFAILIGIFFFNIGIVDVFKILLISRILFGVIGMIFISKWLTRKVKNNLIYELLKFGIPYGIICVIVSVMPALDRYFINQYLTPYHLGIYAVAYKIATLLQLPITAFQTAWGPFYLSLFKEKDASKTYNQVFLLFTAGISIIGLSIILFAKPAILLLAGIKYIDALPIIFPLVLGLIVMSMGWILGIGIDLSKKSYLKLYSNLSGLMITGLSVWILIKPFGLFGVGIGFFLGQLTGTLIETYFSYKAFKLKFKIRNPLLILSTVFILGMATVFYPINNMTANIVINVIIVISFLLIIWWIPLKRTNIVSFLKKENI